MPQENAADMEQIHQDILAESIDRRLEDRDALLRMLTWAREEVVALGGQKSGDHLHRAIECLRHEI